MIRRPGSMRILPADQVAAEKFDRLAPEYDSHFCGPEATAENEVTFDAIGNVDGASVLDVGCGTGLFLEYHTPSVYLGIDISEGMLAVAKKKFPGGTFQLCDMADMRPLGIPRDFDRVVSTFGSFSYCFHPQMAADQMMRALKPGGRLFLMAFTRRYLTRPTHVAADIWFKPYTEIELRRLFPRLENKKVWGLNWISGKVAPRLMGLEAATVGRLEPEAGYFIILEGTCPAA